MGIARDRTFILRHDFQSAYVPKKKLTNADSSSTQPTMHCSWSQEEEGTARSKKNPTIYNSDWDCLYQPLSNCTYDNINIPSDSSGGTGATGTGGGYAYDDYTIDADISKTKASIGILYNNVNTKDGSNKKKRVTNSKYFHTKYYGNQRIASTPSTFYPWMSRTENTDIINDWERTMGRYWIRSQISHYLWKLSENLQYEVDRRIKTMFDYSTEFQDMINSNTNFHYIPISVKTHSTSTSTNNSKKNQRKKYIGIHIRYSDNVGSFEKQFKRNATITRSIPYIMNIAQQMRDEEAKAMAVATNGGGGGGGENDDDDNDNNDVLSTIYVATDSDDKLNELIQYIGTINKKRKKLYWKLHYQKDDSTSNALGGAVPRASKSHGTSDRWLWFKDTRAVSAPAIATDVEILRRADYLIGSYQSNVYRLASVLNTAYHKNQYLYTTTNRIQTVDIPWYEDP